MRSPSVRGQLRYWLRAIAGAENIPLRTLWERESAVFGSTSTGSAVSVRVYRADPAKTSVQAMLPHRRNEGRRQASEQLALSAGQLYDLTLVSRPGVSLPVDAIRAMLLWSLLGGIGKRSRRMFGATQLTTQDETIDWWYETPQNPDALAGLIQDALQLALPGVIPMSQIPNFPTLNPAHSWVIVGQTPFDTHEEAVIDLFRNLLRSPQFIGKAETFGQAMGGRRASPLIAQVRRLRIDGQDQYYPVLTALRSTPDRNIDWAHLKRFMEAAEQHYSAVRVWGGW